MVRRPSSLWQLMCRLACGDAPGRWRSTSVNAQNLSCGATTANAIGLLPHDDEPPRKPWLADIC